ncbi:MAG: DUF3990 domain-containing protein [Spirochaetaceae bacterium]|jgi:hypothetical protein|nr:DUF3990 domain-containing protein [Spirochaetaceae bacterium]
MILYHGSIVSVLEPQIIITEAGRDFGPGFYTTSIKQQAERWARRKAKIQKRLLHEAQAIVSIYEFDETNYDVLRVLHFPEPSIDWLDMVCHCRSDNSFKHGYDIVTGKIANDTVGETVSYVVQGIMRKEDALEKLKFENINDQICFFTNKALQHLTYTGFRKIAL